MPEKHHGGEILFNAQVDGIFSSAAIPSFTASVRRCLFAIKIQKLSLELAIVIGMTIVNVCALIR